MTDFDLAIIGGGLNGAAIARDAAGRGLRVVLMEQHDLGGGATAAASLLMHGSAFDLEQGAFLATRAALGEEDATLRNAPHIARPLHVVVPVHPEGRPLSMVRLWAFLRDRLAGGSLHRRTTILDLTHHEVGIPLQRPIRSALRYSQGFVADSRLAVLNVVDAAERGATILTGTRCVRADRADGWRIALVNRGRREVLSARILVNAAGAWIPSVAETIIRESAPPVRLVKSTAIVVRRLYEHENAYLLQNDDGRTVRLIPCERDFTLIGTVESKFTGDPAMAAASSADVSYLCRAVNRYFRDRIEPSDVVHAVSGVNVLDGGRVRGESSRGVVLPDLKSGIAPLVMVFGGSGMTARRRAERVLASLSSYVVMSKRWTAGAALPGGEFSSAGFEDQVELARQRWPLGEAYARRLVGAYGLRMSDIMATARGEADLGPWFGLELSAAEVRYLMDKEFVRFADDVLWRRSRLGIAMPERDRAVLAHFMATGLAMPA